MGAEDPYGHMERTWDLVQGTAPTDYPPGLMLLLAPFTALGPANFYQVARFLPSLFGLSLAVGTFFLCRRTMHPAGALSAAALVAVMPEAIRRTNLLFPTAVDLAILPWFFLLVLRASDGSRAAWAGVGGCILAILLFHPWALALLAPPLVLFALIVLMKNHRPWQAVVAGAVGLAAFGLLVGFGLRVGSPGEFQVAGVLPKMASLLSNPGSLWPLPPYVDLPWMLTVPALVLAILGAGVALVRRTRFSLLALLLTALLLPIVLVDWFGVWYLPHRTVAYFAIGIAMLCGLAVSEAARIVCEARPRWQGRTSTAAVAAVLLLTLPTALAMPPWYRLFGPSELEAWDAIEDRNAPLVVAGSWQARVGYRALTGEAAVYNVAFFEDAGVRAYELRQAPGLVVLVDNYTRDAGTPTAFLDGGGWERIGQWGTTSAYVAAQRSGA